MDKSVISVDQQGVATILINGKTYNEYMASIVSANTFNGKISSCWNGAVSFTKWALPSLKWVGVSVIMPKIGKIPALLLINLIESFIDNVIFDFCETMEEGCIVYCDMYKFEHSGVYVGDNTIVHLDGNGEILAVSPEEFLDRLGGFNNAITIYTCCVGKKPVGAKDTAKYAKKMIGEKRNYNMLLNNCHMFSAECILGDDVKTKLLFGSLKALKLLVALEYKTRNWRAWNFRETS